MLSEEQELLLTAFVDGDVTREERESIECLLRNSSEARAALRTMQENAHRLKKLSKLHLGQRFTSQVLASLPAQPNGVSGHEPINVTADDGDEPLVRKPKLRRGMPSWVIGAIAAGLILAVIGIGAALVRDRGPNRNLLPSDFVVKNNKPKPAQAPPTVEYAMDPAIEQMLMKISQGFAEAATEKVKPQAQQPVQPTKFAFSDLKQSKSLDYLAWELKRQDSIRIEVHAKYDGREPVNRLIEAFHRQGIHLVVTPPAHKSIKQNLPVLVYAENVASDKLSQALRELSNDVIVGTKKLPTPYERLQMQNGTAKDAVEVARGLGLSMDQLKRPPTPASPDHAEGVVFGLQSEAVLPEQVHEFLGARRAALPGTLQVFVQIVPKS